MTKMAFFSKKSITDIFFAFFFCIFFAKKPTKGGKTEVFSGAEKTRFFLQKMRRKLEKLWHFQEEKRALFSQTHFKMCVWSILYLEKFKKFVKYYLSL
jgi:hypothetical protein